MSDASTPTTGGSTKTKRPDIYPTLGQECGCCGHRQPTVRDTRRCLADYRRREFSDRRPCRCHRRRSRVPGRSSSPLTLGSGVPFALTTAPFGDGVAPGASKGRDSCRRASIPADQRPLRGLLEAAKQTLSGRYAGVCMWGCCGAVCDRSRPARVSLSCSTARVCPSSGPVRGRPRFPVAAAGGRATVASIGQA